MRELVQFTATELTNKMQTREVAVVEVLEAHIQVIEAHNPSINALVTLCLERAIDEANALDQLPQKDVQNHPLFGLPYAVKDTIETAGVRTTFGSKLFANNVPAFDATHVARARAAGAIVIGKSNTPEFAYGGQTNNPIFGLTRNPIDNTKTVTGSTGGSAAALASHMAPMADGSDLGGSLRSPASVCGVVGFRPTAGQVPRHCNPLPFDGLHVFGPMARNVVDIILFMSVFSGPDDSCPLSLAARQLDYLQPVTARFSGTRIAWSTHPCGTQTHPEVARVMNKRRTDFESIGCVIDDACPDIAANQAVQQMIAALNAISELGDYIGNDRLGDSARLRGFLNRGAALSGDEIARSRRTQARCWQTIRTFFEDFDFLVWPTMAGLPFDASLGEGEITEDWRPVELTPSLNLPAISIPAGTSGSGLPIGIQIIGMPGSDHSLLQLSKTIQAITE